MSAAAVSQQVRALEDRLGRALFARHAHSVTLTDAGRSYLPAVQHSLLALENATEGLFGAGPEQQLFVQSVLLFAHGLLSKGYAGFTAAHPEIALTLSTGNHPYDFAKGFSDLQIVFGNPQAYGAESDWLMGERIYPVAERHVAGSIDAPQDLLRHRLIEVVTHRAGWPDMFAHLGLLPGTARYVYADNTIMAMAMAREGVGIALARAPASDKTMHEAGLIPCLDGVSVEGREAYHLAYPERAALRPPARVFRDWLLGWCAGL